MNINETIDKYLMLEKKNDVCCPVCNGEGQSKFVKTNKCLCCDGKGTIDKQHRNSLMSVRKKIKGRMTQ